MTGDRGGGGVGCLPAICFISIHLLENPSAYLDSYHWNKVGGKILSKSDNVEFFQPPAATMALDSGNLTENYPRGEGEGERELSWVYVQNEENGYKWSIYTLFSLHVFAFNCVNNSFEWPNELRFKRFKDL